MDWQQHAARLADQSTEPDSRWLAPVAKTPRHELVPRWWERDGSNGWQLRDGAADPEAWMKAAYADRSLITRVGTLHAERAEPDDQPHGLPTSSATVPSLVVRMLRHGRLGTGLSLLDLGTGAGGLTAYASHLIGAEHVTSLDVDRACVRSARRLHDRGGECASGRDGQGCRAGPRTGDRVAPRMALRRPRCRGKHAPLRRRRCCLECDHVVGHQAFPCRALAPCAASRVYRWRGLAQREQGEAEFE
ncbi:50S ribosomal protein L11 methyltransferase [Streptomyces sp. NPDC048680]|uniref:50S ribosomal protein L11 methyltransferase n=1 Tax=Streptomyces sp. NPDC048680 TaxID=3155492 RepID=UPI00341C9F42